MSVVDDNALRELINTTHRDASRKSTISISVEIFLPIVEELQRRRALSLPLDDPKPIDETLRAVWREHGGSFHGPNVETGTMPEAKLLPFLRRLMTAGYEIGRATSGLKAGERVLAEVDDPDRVWIKGRSGDL